MSRPASPNSRPAPASDLLLDLEVRQDDVLRRLAELEQRVERTLAEFLMAKAGEAKAA
jgi:hypothetical protein